MSTIHLLNVKPYLVIDGGRIGEGICYGKLLELSLEVASQLITYPGTDQRIYRKDIFQTRIKRQIELEKQPVTDDEKSCEQLLSLFTKFCNDDREMSEREKLILFTYLNVDLLEVKKNVDEMSVQSYLIRPSSIADSDGALVRMVTFASVSGRVHNVLITHTVGLGYVMFECDVEKFRLLGMIRMLRMPRMPRMQSDEPDNRHITVLEIRPSLPELLKYMANLFQFRLTDIITA